MDEALCCALVALSPSPTLAVPGVSDGLTLLGVACLAGVRHLVLLHLCPFGCGLVGDDVTSP